MFTMHTQKCIHFYGPLASNKLESLINIDTNKMCACVCFVANKIDGQHNKKSSIPIAHLLRINLNLMLCVWAQCECGNIEKRIAIKSPLNRKQSFVVFFFSASSSSTVTSLSSFSSSIFIDARVRTLYKWFVFYSVFAIDLSTH